MKLKLTYITCIIEFEEKGIVVLFRNSNNYNKKKWQHSNF